MPCNGVCAMQPNFVQRSGGSAALQGCSRWRRRAGTDPSQPEHAPLLAYPTAHCRHLYCLTCTAHTAAGLAQTRYFEDPAFLEYLRYLQYWQQPQYAQYIM